MPTHKRSLIIERPAAPPIVVHVWSEGGSLHWGPVCRDLRGQIVVDLSLSGEQIHEALRLAQTMEEWGDE